MYIVQFDVCFDVDIACKMIHISKSYYGHAVARITCQNWHIFSIFRCIHFLDCHLRFQLRKYIPWYLAAVCFQPMVILKLRPFDFLLPIWVKHIWRKYCLEIFKPMKPNGLDFISKYFFANFRLWNSKSKQRYFYGGNM